VTQVIFLTLKRQKLMPCIVVFVILPKLKLIIAKLHFAFMQKYGYVVCVAKYLASVYPLLKCCPMS